MLLPDISANVGLPLATFACPDCKTIEGIGFREIPGVPLFGLNCGVKPGSCGYREATGLLHV